MLDSEIHRSNIYRNITKQAKVSLALMLEGNWVNLQQTWWNLSLLMLSLQGERATGFGVAMLMALFGQASDDCTLNKVSPLGAATRMSEDQMVRDCKRRRLV